MAKAEAGQSLEAMVEAVAIQLPNFFREAPRAWFNVIEAQFLAKGITVATTKYYHAVAKLDVATCVRIQEFLEEDVTEDSYQRLRDHLCDRFEAKPQVRVEELLKISGLGDKEPKELGDQMARLARKLTVDSFLNRIFLKALPESIRAAIARKANGPFRELVEEAQETWVQLQDTEVNAIKRGSDSAGVAAVARQKPGGASNKSWKQKTSAKPDQLERKELCGFHKRFGNEARQCRAGCPRWAVKRTEVFVVEGQTDTDSEN